MTLYETNNVGLLESIVFVLDIHVQVSATFVSSGPATCM